MVRLAIALELGHIVISGVAAAGSLSLSLAALREPAGDLSGYSL